MNSNTTDASWAKQILRDASLRATAARVAVLRLLANEATPKSHSEVVDALNEFGFDQSTLFRCLNELAEAELVTRLDLGDQTRRFEYRTGDEAAEFTHPHFMCIDCGQLSCMNDFKIQLTPSRGPRRDKLGTITEIMLRGHCGNCETES
jgi:Fur family ferric uptake transcriptional regulator